jgi:DNA polymerase I-like protein with 3'-5' exonuclease and polymerase domains
MVVSNKLKKNKIKQLELFAPGEIPKLTGKEFRDSLKKEFINSKKPALAPRNTPRGDRFIYYSGNNREIQTSFLTTPVKPYPPETFPKIGRETEVLQLLYSENHLGLDFEFSPYTLKPSIIGVGVADRAAACSWNGSVESPVTKALLDAVKRGVIFTGHFVLGADKLVLEKALQLETPHTMWEDSMILHYLCYASLCKAPGKVETEGALGFMGLGTAAHLWLGIPNWKACRGNSCTGPCPKHQVLDYCAVDAWAGLKIAILAREFMREKNIPENIYTEHAFIAWNFCLKSERHGIRVDVQNLAKVDEEIETKKLQLFPVREDGTYEKFNPRSNQQVLAYFHSNGEKLKDNTKQTLLDRCTIIAENYGFESLKALLETPEENRPQFLPIEQDLLNLFLFKDSGKGSEPWFGEKYLKNNFVHPRFNFTGTSTMRLSSSNPNFQNIGAHNWGLALKKLIIPRNENYKLLSADASNLELRTVLYASGIDVGNVGDAFKWLVEQTGGAFKSTAEELGKTERDIAKIVSHASDYLMGLGLYSENEIKSGYILQTIKAGALQIFEDWRYYGYIVGFTGSKLAHMLYKTKTFEARKKALDIQKIYFDAFPSIRNWHRQILAQAEKGFVQTVWGDYLELVGNEHKNAKVAAAKIGQGLGAVYVQGKMYEYLVKYPNFENPLNVNMIGQVHDEILWEIPRNWDDLTIKDFCSILKQESHRLPGFRCPWKAKVGDNWGQMTQVEI